MDLFQISERKLAFIKKLARLVFNKYRPGVIGVAGSIGKTSTQEAICAVLGTERRVRGNNFSFSPEVSIPLAIISDIEIRAGFWFFVRVVVRALLLILFRDSKYPEIFVFSYGISAPQGMKKLLEIVRPQVVVISSIGTLPSFSEFFENPKALTREFMRLLQQMPTTGFAVINADDEEVNLLREHTRGQVTGFGFSKKADLLITNFSENLNADGSVLAAKFEYGGNMIPVRLYNAVGKTQIYAAAAASAVSLIFGINMVKISDALSKFLVPSGMSRVVPGMRGSVLIDETFDAVPLSMDEALHNLKRLGEGKRKIAVLSDMSDLGKYTLDVHTTAGSYAATACDLLLTIGMKGKFIADGALKSGMSRRSIVVCSSILEAKRILEATLKPGDVVLVKGSRETRLERLVRDLMREPGLARSVLARQESYWDSIPGLYDRDVSMADLG